jgi:hypothetical protein
MKNKAKPEVSTSKRQRSIGMFDEVRVVLVKTRRPAKARTR